MFRLRKNHMIPKEDPFKGIISTCLPLGTVKPTGYLLNKINRQLLISVSHSLPHQNDKV